MTGAPVIVTTPDELRAIVRAAVREEIGARAASTDLEWLDAKGVAAMLHVHPRSVQKMVRHQGLPAHRLGPKLLRYRPDEIERWMKERGR